MMSRLLWTSLLAALGLTLIACDTLGYYGQAATGQISLLMQRQTLERLLADDSLPNVDRERLTTVLRANEFAEQQLGLQAGGSYLSYVNLGREHVLWNVFAACVSAGLATRISPLSARSIVTMIPKVT